MPHEEALPETFDRTPRLVLWDWNGTLLDDAAYAMRKAFEERRDVLVKGINAIDGLSCLKPEGAFYVMMNVTRLMGKRYENQLINDSAAFADTLLTYGKVSVVPGSAFMAEGFCRLSYATSREEILEGLRRIETFVTKLA